MAEKTAIKSVFFFSESVLTAQDFSKYEIAVGCVSVLSRSDFCSLSSGTEKVSMYSFFS